MLRDGVYGNPHSVNPTSSAATELVERARAAVLRYFNAPESEYECIFTPNATGALRLVGEAYPFGRFLATFDNHNSVNGIRSSPARGAPRRRTCRSRRPISAWPASSRITSTSRRPQPVRLSGAVELLRRQAPAQWIDLAHERAGTCSWTAPRSRRRAGSTCRRGSRTSSRCRSTRCSATRPAWAR